VIIPQLEIRQQSSKIALKSVNPSIEIKKKNVKSKMNCVSGKIEIKSKDAFIKIDNYPSRYDIGFKKTYDFTRDNYRKTQKKVLEIISQYSREGDRLMEYEKKGAITELAKIKTPMRTRRELTLKSIRGPKLDISLPRQEIKHRPGRVKVDISTYTPVKVKLNWGKIKTILVQKANTEITLREQEIGRYVNRVI
jgi:hypothetical protein